MENIYESLFYMINFGFGWIRLEVWIISKKFPQASAVTSFYDYICLQFLKQGNIVTIY